MILWARQLAWLQCADAENQPTRWIQLDRASHILPEQGDLFDAAYILQRVGFYAPMGMGGILPIRAGQIADFVAATCGLISPIEVDAALLASDAYVGEYHRSNNRSTDAPWDWPKSKRDLEIFDAQTTKALKVITGE